MNLGKLLTNQSISVTSSFTYAPTFTGTDSINYFTQAYAMGFYRNGANGEIHSVGSQTTPMN